MSTYFETLETTEGRVFIVTKRRWLGIFSCPHTSVMPYRAADLKHFGTFIHWSTRDPAMLEKLHNAILQFVVRDGISGLWEFANGVKKSDRIWDESGPNTRTWIQEMSRQTVEDGVVWPLPEEIFRYIRKFK